jgi:uncharacterized surface anchored protein
MTQREFLENVANGIMNDEMTTFATERLTAMDIANEKRREANSVKRAEKEAEKAPIRQAIMAVITSEPKTATTLIAEAGVEIKPQAIPSLLKGVIEEGVVLKVDVKVKGKGTQRGYTLAE